MTSYKPLDHLVNTVGGYIQNSSEKIKTGVKYGIIFPAALAVGLSIAPKLQNVIHNIIPSTSTNISQVVAAELNQSTYQLFKNQVDAIDYANKNMWNMEQEFNKNPEFQEFKNEFNSFLNYPNPNHKLLMDFDKLESIKLNGKNGSYETVLFVGDLKPENSLKTGEIFNIPEGVNTEQYMNNLLKDVYLFNKQYQELIEKKDAETPKETVEDKVREAQQTVISEVQEAKQRKIDDYISGNLKSTGGSIVVVDLDDFNKKINVYNVENANEMLKALDIPNNAIVSYNEFSGITGHNIISDYGNLDDGKNQIIVDKDGFTFLFDVPNGTQGYKAVSRIQKSRLENLITTDDAGAVVSDILANKSRVHYIIRNLKDEKPSFGIFSVPIDMKVKVGEILAKYIEGVKEGYDGARFIFPASVSREGGGSDIPVTPVTPVTPVIPPGPIPPGSCEDENFNDNPSTTGQNNGSQWYNNTQEEDETGVDATIGGEDQYDSLLDSLKTGGI